MRSPGEPGRAPPRPRRGGGGPCSGAGAGAGAGSPAAGRGNPQPPELAGSIFRAGFMGISIELKLLVIP